jgi:hypothetical protein
MPGHNLAHLVVDLGVRVEGQGVCVGCYCRCRVRRVSDDLSFGLGVGKRHWSELDQERRRLGFFEENGKHIGGAGGGGGAMGGGGKC